jgi:hypothetical protein
MGDPQNVQILYDAELNAMHQFGLNTKSDLLSFIGNGALQNMSYINTEPWRNNPKKDIMEVYIDSYNFRSNRKLGYIAFMKGISGKYVIKSFHLDHHKITLGNTGNNSTKSLG